MWTKILCPFHEESVPSAVYSDDGGFNCFACSTKGQLHYLLREVLKLDVDSANKRYEEIVGEAYQGVRKPTSLIPGREVLADKRDYERGSELFPPWFRGAT